LDKLRKYIDAPVSIAPLAVFRVLFGFIMLISIIRFMAKGWVYDLYIMPKVYFPYFGFEWVKPLGEWGMYAIFIVMAVAVFFVMLGFYYRLSMALFFLCFTYVELIDKTNYLNHYYFISIMSALLIFLPAHRYFSLDVIRKPEWEVSKVPAWTINTVKLQLGIVYFFAGLAKLNPDWLLHALPLKIWLPAKSHLPIVGGLLELPATAFVFSWAGAIFDLCIFFFLLNNKARPWAYIAVVAFHLSTALLFQIGMFPYIMILSTLIFFSANFHQDVIGKIKKFAANVGFRAKNIDPSSGTSGLESLRYRKHTLRLLGALMICHFIIQTMLPLRFALYPGNLFWTEQGYRFSWRVMLMEKAGYATFNVTDPATRRTWQINNWEYLTPNQEKMMATQPDMILQFANHLKDELKGQGVQRPIITAECYVSLNGRRSRLLIDPEINLAGINDDFAHKDWVLPLEENTLTATKTAWIR